MVTKTISKEEEIAREVTDNLSTIFKIKCSIKDYREFDEKCKEWFGDSRHVMLKTCLNFWEGIFPILSNMEQKLELVHVLATRLLQLEDEVKSLKGKKEIKTNDGRIVGK